MQWSTFPANGPLPLDIQEKYYRNIEMSNFHKLDTRNSFTDTSPVSPGWPWSMRMRETWNADVFCRILCDFLADLFALFKLWLKNWNKQIILCLDSHSMFVSHEVLVKSLLIRTRHYFSFTTCDITTFCGGQDMVTSHFYKKSLSKHSIYSSILFKMSLIVVTSAYHSYEHLPKEGRRNCSLIFFYLFIFIENDS